MQVVAAKPAGLSASFRAVVGCMVEVQEWLRSADDEQAGARRGEEEAGARRRHVVCFSSHDASHLSPPSWGGGDPPAQGQGGARDVAIAKLYDLVRLQGEWLSECRAQLCVTATCNRHV